MHTEYLIGEGLSRLQKGKEKICVSIIIPTHELLPGRRVDVKEVKKVVNKAKEFLITQYKVQETQQLRQSIDDLFQQINFMHNKEGIGLFVSEKVSQLTSFFFPVTEKIIIADAFETRDLIYQLYYEHPYYVLQLTEKEARLYLGVFNQLEEINDTHFPLYYKDEYEYSRPNRGLSYEGYGVTRDFEREKSQLQQIRNEKFIQEVNELLKNYLDDQTLLVLTGDKKELSYLKKEIKHYSVAGEIYGNYSYAPIVKLGALTWEKIEAHLNAKKPLLIQRLEENKGTGHTLCGIKDVWKAAVEGRGATLLVEKEFYYPGYLKKGKEYDLLLVPPKGPHQILPDAINTLMDIVLAKGGNVVLVENNALSTCQHIAMSTRY